MSYFVIVRSLQENFDSIEVRYVPWLKNQEANYLVQNYFGYKVPKGKLDKLIKVRGKLVPTNLPSSNALIPKLIEVEGLW